MVSSLVARLFAASWLAALTLLLLEGLWLFATGVAPAQLLDLAAAAAAPLIPCAGFGMGAWLLAHLPRRFLPLLPGHRALDLILLAGAVASFLALMLFGPQLRGYHHLIVLLPWGFGWMALHQRKPRRWASAAALLTALAALAAGLLLGAGGRLHDAMDRSVVVSGFARLSARIGMAGPPCKDGASVTIWPPPSAGGAWRSWGTAETTTASGET